MVSFSHGIVNKGPKLTDQFDLGTRAAHVRELFGCSASPANCCPRVEDIGEHEGGYGRADAGT